MFHMETLKFKFFSSLKGSSSVSRLNSRKLNVLFPKYLLGAVSVTSCHQIHHSILLQSARLLTVHINETLEHETSWNSPVPWQVVQKKKQTEASQSPKNLQQDPLNGPLNLGI